MDNIERKVDQTPSAPITKPVTEAGELSDKDEFGGKPYPWCAVYAYSDTMTPKQLREAFLNGIRAFMTAVNATGAQGDWDMDIEWVDEDGNEYRYQDIAEGLSPLSHDNSIARKIRKHKTPRSRRHMDGSDRYRVPDPKGKILARIRRASRHQPKPEVEEAYKFISTNMGKMLTEADLKQVTDRNLLISAVETLAAIAYGGWEMCEGGITNGQYILEGEDYGVKGGVVLYKNSPLKLNWDWLYNTRQLLRSCNVAQLQEELKKVIK